MRRYIDDYKNGKYIFIGDFDSYNVIKYNVSEVKLFEILKIAIFLYDGIFIPAAYFWQSYPMSVILPKIQLLIENEIVLPTIRNYQVTSDVKEYFERRESDTQNLLGTFCTQIPELRAEIATKDNLKDALVLHRMDNIAKYLIERGIQVIMEGVGHLNLEQIEQYTKQMRKEIYIPFMPLGPIATDRAIGVDNVSNAIGAAFMAYQGGADIINSVTKEEHTGGVPSINSIEEAIKSAKVVVKTIEDIKFFNILKEEKMGTYVNCMNKQSERIGCARCSFECPFKLNEVLKEF